MTFFHEFLEVTVVTREKKVCWKSAKPLKTLPDFALIQLLVGHIHKI